jgi:hypothetical protein
LLCRRQPRRTALLIANLANNGLSIVSTAIQQFRNVGYFTTFRPGRSILVAVEPLEIEWLGR